VAMEAAKVDEHTTIGTFVDPQGTMFGVYTEEH
jgi:hypothetical protein